MHIDERFWAVFLGILITGVNIFLPLPKKTFPLWTAWQRSAAIRFISILLAGLMLAQKKAFGLIYPEATFLIFATTLFGGIFVEMAVFFWKDKKQ